MIKIIEHNDKIYAKLIRASYTPKETEFYSSPTDEIQFGIIKYQKDYKTGAHYHNKPETITTPIDEILMIQKGSARIDFYSNEGLYIKSIEIFKNDTIILYRGGHNIKFYEDTDVIKIKPGAWDEKDNKTRIIGANNLELAIEED